MLQVLNAKERNLAFIQFIVFFLVTTALVVGAIYFNFRVPVKENEMLREEVEIQRIENLNQQKFVAYMEVAETFLDSIGKSGVNVSQVDVQLNSRLTDLGTLAQKDSSLYGKLNMAIVNAFHELQLAKKEIRELNEKAEKAEVLDRNLKECEARLDDYRRAYGQLNMPR